MGLVEVGASGEDWFWCRTEDVNLLSKRVCVLEEKEESLGRGKLKDAFLIDVRWPKG